MKHHTTFLPSLHDQEPRSLRPRSGMGIRFLIVPIIAGILGFQLSAFSAPTILNYATAVSPSDYFTLQGDSFGSNVKIYGSVNHGAATAWNTINNSANGVAQAQIPVSPTGLYQVSIVSSNGTSNVVTLNQAFPMQCSTPEIAKGDSFQIYGRNLRPWYAAANPQVRLQPLNASGAASGSPVAATVTGWSNNNCLTVTAPTVTTGKVYNVQVWNGLGNASGDFSGLTCRAPRNLPTANIVGRSSAGTDAFELGVPWARDYIKTVYNAKTDVRLPSPRATGDGVTNDQPALQSALTWLGANGGGILHCPAGTYKLLCPNVNGDGRPQGWGLLNIPSNVVLKGAGQGSTIMSYGYEADPNWAMFASFWNASKAGIYNLTVQDVGWPDNGPNNVIASINAGMSTGKNSMLFLSKVTFDIRGAQHLNFIGQDRFVLSSCTINATSSDALLCANSSNCVIKNSTLITKKGVCLSVAASNNSVVQSNSIVLDGNDGVAIAGAVRHGVVFDQTSNLAIVNNSFSTINGNPNVTNDGEAILSEVNNATGQELGTVSSAAGTTLTVSPKFGVTPPWPPTGSIGRSYYVTIIKGPGVGQTRTITSRSGNTLTLNATWTVVPTNASAYGVGEWMAENTTISNNAISGWTCGVCIYRGQATDVEVSFNTIQDMTILLQPFQSSAAIGGAPNGYFGMMWNNTILDNTLTGRGWLGTGIHLAPGIMGVQDGQTLQGTLMMNTEVRRNKVIGNNFKGAWLYGQTLSGDYYWSPCVEGITNVLQVESWHSIYDDAGTPGVLGNQFQGNQVDFCNAQGYLTNGGAYQTVFAANTIANGKTDTTNDGYGNLTRTSVNTADLSNTYGTLGKMFQDDDSTMQGASRILSGAYTSSSSASSFTGTGGSYLHCVIPASSPGWPNLVTYVPNSPDNSWSAMLGSRTIGSTTFQTMNGGYDFFVRPTGTTDMSNLNWFRHQAYPGGLTVIFQGMNGGVLQLWVQSSDPMGVSATPDFTNGVASNQGLPNSLAYMPAPFAINQVSHMAVTFSTDPATGLTTVKVFGAPGTGAIDTNSTANLIKQQSFYLKACPDAGNDSWGIYTIPGISLVNTFDYDAIRLYYGGVQGVLPSL